MAFTWASSALESSTSTGYDRARLRIAIGDVSTARPVYLDDATVDYFLASEPSFDASAVKAIDALLAQWATVATDKRVGDLQLKRTELERLATVRAEHKAESAGIAVPYVGGTSISEKQEREDDTDRVAPAFVRGMHDIPGSHLRGGRTGST